MARKGIRPRVLNGILGGYILLIAIVAWYFANSSMGSGYVYGPETTRWAFLAYMVTAAALLSGIGSVAVSSIHHLDRRIDEAEARLGAVASFRDEEPAVESDELPPPLVEETGEKDHVDKDIDELLVSLQEIETSAEGSSEVSEDVTVAVTEAPSRRSMVVRSSKALEALKRQRRYVPGFFAGPGLAAIGIIAITAMLLPGADVMLQNYNALNTTLILGIGYAYPGIALMTGLAFYAILRRK